MIAMYKVNDTVLYGIDGVCRISDIVVKPVYGERIEYYVLKTCSQENTTIYIPTGNDNLVSKMCRILSPGEILELIRMMPEEDTIWIDDEKERKTRYSEILSGNDRRKIFKLIKTLRIHQEKLKEQGRRLHIADERFFRDAEKRLYDEFAYGLQIEPCEVLPFITKRLEAQGRRAYE